MGRRAIPSTPCGRCGESLRQHDRLFFLVGADAFLDLPHWREFRRLLDAVEFIVVSRPGFDVDALRQVATAGPAAGAAPCPKG